MPSCNRNFGKDPAVRARAVIVVLFVWIAAGHAGAAGFFTQKELVGHDGDTLVVLPPLTFVVADEHFGKYVRVSYEAGDDVRELWVRLADLEAVRPNEEQAAQRADREKLQAFYRERIPFDVSIGEFRETAAADDTSSASSRYRMRIRTRSLLPADLSNIRFEVHVFLDAPCEESARVLWQLRIMTAERCEFKTVETPLFSIETLRASARQSDAQSTCPPASESKIEPEASGSPPRMRFAVRLFVEGMFIDQRTGVVEQTAHEDDQLFREAGPLSPVAVSRDGSDHPSLVDAKAPPSR